MSKQAKNYLALALDNVSEKNQIENLVNTLSDYIGIFKIGLEQYIRFGPEIIELVRKKDNKIFLDLKLHDIPNTVAKAVIAASRHNINYLSIHTSGGMKMMKEAVKAARSVENPPKLIGVTVLTSIDQGSLNNELRINCSVTDQVAHLAQMAVKAGLGGIVCSAVDLPNIKNNLPDPFEIITPGIRPADAEMGDQKRVATPQQAIENGATMLVIGRPITASDDPAGAAKKIYKSIKN